MLTWREEEQFFTEKMARILRKPQFLLPRPMLAEVGYQLIFEPRRTKAYLSYPMQHVAEAPPAAPPNFNLVSPTF